MTIRCGLSAFLLLSATAFCGGCTVPHPAPDAPEIPERADAPPPVSAPAPAAPEKLPEIPVKAEVPKPSPLPVPAHEAVSMILPPDPETGKFIRSDSSLNYWSLLALPTRPEGDAGVILNAELLPGEHLLRPLPGDSRWKTVTLAGPGEAGQTLGTLIPVQDAVLYLAARLDSSRAWEHLKLHLGGGGLQKLWLNGELLYADTRGARPAAAQEEIPDITLKQGENILLIKTVRNAPQWDLQLYFSAPDGTPLRIAALEKSGK